MWRESDGTKMAFPDRLEIGSGGEARVFAVLGSADLAAKIYRHPSAERAAKLRAMLRQTPPEFAAAMAAYPRPPIDVAWPIDLILTAPPQAKSAGDNAADAAGFLMPRVVGVAPLADAFNPAARRRQLAGFTWRHLLRVARNLAAAVNRLHERGIVIGDLNELNATVAQSALVTLLDTDSFQITDRATGRTFPCRVGKIEFAPPELQGENFALAERLATHDRFALAVLIFQLLMEGTHPFAGLLPDFPGDPPAIGKRIAQGWFAYATDAQSPIRPMPAAPPYSLLPPAIRYLFDTCFIEGHATPAARPTAERWRDAIADAEAGLVECRANSQHVFGDHLAACPWCERAAMLGRDPYPTMEMLRREIAAKSAAPAPAYARPAIPAAKPKPRKPRNAHPWGVLAPPTPPASKPFPPGLAAFSVIILLAVVAMLISAAMRSSRAPQRFAGASTFNGSWSPTYDFRNIPSPSMPSFARLTDVPTRSIPVAPPPPQFPPDAWLRFDALSPMHLAEPAAAVPIPHANPAADSPLTRVTRHEFRGSKLAVSLASDPNLWRASRTRYGSQLWYEGRLACTITVNPLGYLRIRASDATFPESALVATAIEQHSNARNVVGDIAHTMHESLARDPYTGVWRYECRYEIGPTFWPIIGHEVLLIHRDKIWLLVARVDLQIDCSGESATQNAIERAMVFARCNAVLATATLEIGPAEPEKRGR